MRVYVTVWLLLTAFFGYEYFALNLGGAPSILKILEAKHIVHFAVSPQAGKPLSLYLGWVGLGLMILMNVYSMRKRLSFLHGQGRLSSWLNFHVFCGLLGPTFVLFHSNFHVRGLVSISFWSMVVSLTSGVIGRYFYQQVAFKRADYNVEGERWLNRVKRSLQESKVQWNDKAYGPYIAGALTLAGVPRQRGLDPFRMFIESVKGDWRLRTHGVEIPDEWPYKASVALEYYAINVRRAATLESFQSLMGYWHAFHFPFAIFMYVSAAFHVAASLVFFG